VAVSLQTLKVVPSETSSEPDEDKGMVLGPPEEDKAGGEEEEEEGEDEEEGGEEAKAAFAGALVVVAAVAVVVAVVVVAVPAAVNGDLLEAPGAADPPVAPARAFEAGKGPEEGEGAEESFDKSSSTSILATGTTPASVGMHPPKASPPAREWPAVLAGPVGLP
jgi:hypothetical protein